MTRGVMPGHGPAKIEVSRGCTVHLECYASAAQWLAVELGIPCEHVSFRHVALNFSSAGERDAFFALLAERVKPPRPIWPERPRGRR